MATSEELVTAFVEFFEDGNGQLQHPGNTGKGRNVSSVCREILAEPNPILYDTLVDWDRKHADSVNGGTVGGVLRISELLRSSGQWEAAWAVAQLHYDQTIKQEAKTGNRLHKGHPACGLGILAHELGSPRICRHYASLSSAGDVYWEHENADLKFGGLGPTLLEAYESTLKHQRWRERVRSDMLQGGPCDGRKPLYFEAFVAASWFESRARHVLSLAKINANNGKPFTDVLIEAVGNAPEHKEDNKNKSKKENKDKYNETGTRFEAAAGLLLASTPGFEVDSARQTYDDQVDLVVRYDPDGLSELGLESGFGLVECKSSKKRIGAAELRDFGSKCLFRRVRFGILVTRAGITKGPNNELVKFTNPMNAELVRRRFQLDGLTLLVLDISHLSGKSRELRGLQDDLRADYRRLVFGDVP